MIANVNRQQKKDENIQQL